LSMGIMLGMPPRFRYGATAAIIIFLFLVFCFCICVWFGTMCDVFKKTTTEVWSPIREANLFKWQVAFVLSCTCVVFLTAYLFIRPTSPRFVEVYLAASDRAFKRRDVSVNVKVEPSPLKLMPPGGTITLTYPSGFFVPFVTPACYLVNGGDRSMTRSSVMCGATTDTSVVITTAGAAIASIIQDNVVYIVNLTLSGLTTASDISKGCEGTKFSVQTSSDVIAFWYYDPDRTCLVSCFSHLRSLHALLLNPSLPSLPFRPQRDGSNLYMTLHYHQIDGETEKHDTETPLQVPAGWQIAGGDSDDIRVCGAYHWQSYCLVFANGEAFYTHVAKYDLSGQKLFEAPQFVQDEKGVRSKYERCDVLLRRRA
jgi:hypothetical protein